MKKLVYSKDGYRFIDIEFNNRRDFIDYLKKAPTSLTFNGNELASKEMSEYRNDFTGTKTFEEALQLFENGWYEEFTNFLNLKKQIDKLMPYVALKRNFENNVHGSSPNVVNAIKNLPNSMRKTCNINNGKEFRVFVNAGYPWIVKKEQIMHLGVFTLSLLDFLDSIGYRTNLTTFEIATEGNEILYIKNDLKKAGDGQNLQKYYFSFCHTAYLRRLIFRVTETIPELSNVWINSYGKILFIDRIKEVLDLNDNVILISNPDEIGIKGKDLKEDIKAFLDYVLLGKKIILDEKNYTIVDNQKVLRKSKF